MTIAEALLEGAQTAVIGLATVFSVLIILMIVIFIMKLVFYKQPKKQVKEETPVAAVETPKIEEIEDSELIAVITAAVAASLNTSTYNLQIKSVRRVDNKLPAWNRAGISDTINNRF